MKGENAMIKNFKQLVTAISEIDSEETRDYVFSEIDQSFNREKITWKEHEMLFQIVRKMAV